MSIAILVRFLLAMTVEIWDGECWPFQQNFATFPIVGQIGKTRSPLGKGPSQEEVAFLVAYDQGSYGVEFCI